MWSDPMWHITLAWLAALVWGARHVIRKVRRTNRWADAIDEKNRWLEHGR